MTSDCRQAEVWAGAVALHEATQAELENYRQHLAECERCARELGGELALQRLAQAIAQARDEERWAPDLRAAARLRTRRFAWRGAAAMLVAALLGAGVSSAVLRHHVDARQGDLARMEAQAIAAIRTIPTGPMYAARSESLALLPSKTNAAFVISVDRQGRALKCRITRSSGDAALDRRLCQAALRHDYLPAR